MPIAEFPLPSVSASNPQPNVWYQVPEQFQVGSTDYDDGGKDVKLQAGGVGQKRWVLNYRGLDQTKVAILDGHMLTAKIDSSGLSANVFNYRDRDGTLYANVRYERYERPAHEQLWNQSRSIVLVKFP